jgi:hypothetical protein
MGGGVYAHRCTHGGPPRPHLIVQCCRRVKSMLSTPNNLDSKGLQNFKSRSRLRLVETLNGRLKKYECLNQTFRHGREKQSLAFKAVIVTIQYHMDNGSELYKVLYLY